MLLASSSGVWSGTTVVWSPDSMVYTSSLFSVTKLQHLINIKRHILDKSRNKTDKTLANVAIGAVWLICKGVGDKKTMPFACYYVLKTLFLQNIILLVVLLLVVLTEYTEATNKGTTSISGAVV